MTDRDDQQPRPLGADVQLDSAETLDGPAGGGDALDAGYVPPDRPYGLDEDGVTGAGMREGDSLDERLRREEPEGREELEESPADVERSGRLAPPASDPAADGMDAVDAEVDAAEAGSPRAFVDARADLEEESTGRHALREDPASTVDAARDAAGAAAPASGRDDVGPGSGL